MRAAIYNPYLDTLGGGERYTLGFAKVLLSIGYSVDLEWKDIEIIEQLQKRFGITLKGINVVSDINRGDGYDLCFWVSDGSIPLLKSRKNILHFQVPFHSVNGKSLLNKMKLFRIDEIICNSKFTKKIIDTEFGVKSTVIYPPVDIKSFRPRRKENAILFVGRFSTLKQNKGQEVLVKAFKKMCNEGLKGWQLVLAGGVEVGTGSFVTKLEHISDGYPIEIVKSPDFSLLKDYYGKAKIFWSASGFGIDENKNPELVEHFGITVVEAMSAGAVPVVLAAGGHKEIIIDNINGLLWANTSVLRRNTINLINNPQKLHKLADGSKKSAENFSETLFKEHVSSLILKK